LDPAVERITTVDERAKEQVKKAREYAAAVAESRSKDCEAAADAEREAARERTADAVRACEDRANGAIAAARAEADAKIRVIRRAEEEIGDAVATAIAREITGGAL